MTSKVNVPGWVIWSEHGTGAVRRLEPDGNVTELYRLPPPLYDLKLISSANVHGERDPTLCTL